jgi:hypothetical protein
VRRVLRVEHQERLHVEDGLADTRVTMDGCIVHEQNDACILVLVACSKVQEHSVDEVLKD